MLCLYHVLSPVSQTISTHIRELQNLLTFVDCVLALDLEMFIWLLAISVYDHCAFFTKPKGPAAPEVGTSVTLTKIFNS